MDNKKYLPFKIAHLVFMAIAIGLVVFSIVNIANDPLGDIISYLQCGSALLALISGFIYIISGYKKNAVAYYKGYVWILLIAEGIAACVAISYGNSYIIKFAKMACVILFAMLATGKDMGKKRSYNIAGILLIIEVALLVHYLIKYLPGIDATLLPYIFEPIEHVVLTITTIFMVCGKYIDKESRGAI